MVQSLNRLKESPSQTAGPYIHIGATPNYCGVEMYGAAGDLGRVLVGPNAKGERIVIAGRVIDGAGAPLTDALVEIWQADAAGLYNSPQEERGPADPAFAGWGRQPTDASGIFRFETIKPGRAPFVDGRLMAPHVTFWIVARGINLGLHTRMYFSDEAEANAQCPVLLRVENRDRVATLIGARGEDRGRPVYAFDIRLQGAQETIFFDI
jgi:protocatechuate 3,4-dioxygenase alpha subunit